jgi:hypothetical protein
MENFVRWLSSKLSFGGANSTAGFFPASQGDGTTAWERIGARRLQLSKGSDIASAASLTIGTGGNYFDVTGTTTVTSIATVGIGAEITLQFDGILTLTHNAADLVLPTGANITTAAGDHATFVEYATGDWRCTQYTRADGTALVGGSSTPDALKTVINAASKSVGDVVLYDASDAQADTAANAEAIGVIESISGSDNTIVTSGKITLASGVWPDSATGGDVLFLSAGTAALLTTTKTSTVGEIQKAMVVCTSTTAGFVVNYLGNEVV